MTFSYNVVSVTKSTANAKRPRYVRYRVFFKILQSIVIPIYTVEEGLRKLLLVFHYNWP